MPRNSAPRFTKVYAGGYRAIASVNKSAAVLAVLMQYSDSPKPRGGYDPASSPELRGGVPVSIPVPTICDLTGLDAKQVANAIGSLKGKTVYTRGGKAVPLLELLDHAHNGRTAVYALHVENSPSTEPWEFFSEPPKATGTQVPTADGVATAKPEPTQEAKGTGLADKGTGLADKGTGLVERSYWNSSMKLLLQQYPNNYKEGNNCIQRGDDKNAPPESTSKLARSNCPKCGTGIAGQITEAGTLFGYCPKCRESVSMPVPSELKAVRGEDGYTLERMDGLTDGPDDAERG